MLREHLAPMEKLQRVVLNNPIAQQKLAQAPDRAGFVKLAIEFGWQSGFNITAEELSKVIEYRTAINRVDMWLNDEWLESVAGNQAKQSDTGTCTCVGCGTVSTLGCHTGNQCACSR